MSHSKTVLSNFITALYESELDLPPKSEVEEVVESFLSELPKKARRTTNPGDAFDQALCRCRVWNKGYGKQCSAASKVDGLCKSHSEKIAEFGGWAYGFYDEEAPTTHLVDYNKAKAGTSLSWKKDSKAPKKVLTDEVIELKLEYNRVVGRKAGGPKANDPEWLRTKIDEYDPEDPEPKKSSGRKLSKEVLDLKEEYKRVVGKKAGGPKANDPEWLKAKIQDAKIESSSSEDEQLDEDDGSESDSSEEEEIIPRGRKGVNVDLTDLPDINHSVQEKAGLIIDEGISLIDSAVGPVENSLSKLRAARVCFERALEIEPEYTLAQEYLDTVLGRLQTHEQYRFQDEMEGEAAIVLQRHVRVFLQRRSDECAGAVASAEEYSATILQAHARGFLQRKVDTPEGERIEHEGTAYYKRKVNSKYRIFDKNDVDVGRWSKKKNIIIFN